jgi:hypothetical protein
LTNLHLLFQQIITILFSWYIRQMHFQVAEFLPSREGLKEDLRHAAEDDREPDWSFLRGAYIQPELRAGGEKQVVVVVVQQPSSSGDNDDDDDVDGDASIWRQSSLVEC